VECCPLKERKDSAQSAAEKKRLSEIIALARARRLPTDFVASFSEEGDDPSQWRSYCSGAAGFSIGFSSDALRSQWVSDPAGGKPYFVGGALLKISYLSKADISEADLAIDDASVGRSTPRENGVLRTNFRRASCFSLDFPRCAFL
jgi:hypothetical protein